MTEPFFPDIEAIRYEGPETQNPLAYRYYDRDRIVLGKRMEDHLRFAVCYWHTFCWPGTDMFGAATFERPWLREPASLELARLKTDVAFEFFAKLGAPFFTFHDRDVAPEGATLAASEANLDRIADHMAAAMERTGFDSSGAPPTCSVIRATPPAQRRIPTPTSSPTRRPR